MKLLILKLIALLLLLGGALMLGMALNLDQAWSVYNQCLGYWPAVENGTPYFGIPGIFLGAFMTLLGLYAFLPRIPSAKNKYITYAGDQGTVMLELAPMRKSLLKILGKMDEIAKIKIQLRPDRRRQHVCVTANVILNSRKDFSKEADAKTIARCLSVACREVLGFEGISSVVVNVRGIRLNPAETEKKIRKHLSELDAQKEAVASPPANGSDATAAEKESEIKEQPEASSDTTTPLKETPAISESPAPVAAPAPAEEQNEASSEQEEPPVADVSSDTDNAPCCCASAAEDDTPEEADNADTLPESPAPEEAAENEAVGTCAADDTVCEESCPETLPPLASEEEDIPDALPEAVNSDDSEAEEKNSGTSWQ